MPELQEEKTCTGCGLSKPITAFPERVKGQRRDKCRSCRRTFSAKELTGMRARARAKSKPRARARAARLRLKQRGILNHIKDCPCADCGNKYPPFVMDFDHRPGEKKMFNIAKELGRGTATLLREVQKCDVVCANCHRIRTHNRRIARAAA